MADKAFEKQLEELKKLAGVGSYGLTLIHLHRKILVQLQIN